MAEGLSSRVAVMGLTEPTDLDCPVAVLDYTG